ncbi:MAG: SGNH hydrolase domain-containing protein [Saprospiraceae bacterium]
MDLVLLGESHCGHLMYGIDSIFVKKHKKNVYIPNLMNPSAIFLPDIIPTHLEEKEVKKIIAKTVKILKQNPDATLLISHYWAVQLNRSKAKLADGRIIKLSNQEESFNVLINKIEKLLKLAGERKVIIFGTGPIMSYANKLNHIERILKPNYQGNTKNRTTTFVPNENYYHINKFFQQYVEEKPSFFYFDPREPFCNQKSCLVQKENQIFLSDWDHLSKDGSLTVIQYFEKRILRIINRQ